MSTPRKNPEPLASGWIKSRSIGACLSIVGGTLMTIGTLLPWLVVAPPVSFSRNGFQLGAARGKASGDLDSWLTLAAPIWVGLGVLSVLVGVVFLTRSGTNRRLGVASIVIALLGVLPLSLGWTRIHDFVFIEFLSGAVTNRQLAPAEISAGTGFWLCVVGTLLTLMGGMILGPGGRKLSFSRKRRGSGEQRDLNRLTSP